MRGDWCKVTGDGLQAQEVIFIVKSEWFVLFKHGRYQYEILSHCLFHFNFH